MASEAEIQAAALGIINARRKQCNVDAIFWDSASLTDTDRKLALEQGRAALEAAERVRCSHSEWEPDSDTCKQCGIHMDDLPSPESKSK